MRSLKYLFVIVFVSALFSSCLKDSEVSLPRAAYLNIVHASPRAGNLYFKLSPNWITPDNFEYRAYSGYISAAPGSRIFEVYKRVSDAKFVSATLPLMESKFYSVFLIDTLSKMETVLLRDSTRDAGNDSVRIRFANFISDVPSVDFYVQGNATPVATNISFKTANNFESMKKGSNVVFEVRLAGQSTVLATGQAVDLYDRNIYTIYATGYRAATDDAKVIIGRMRHL